MSHEFTSAEPCPHRHMPRKEHVMISGSRVASGPHALCGLYWDADHYRMVLVVDLKGRPLTWVERERLGGRSSPPANYATDGRDWAQYVEGSGWVDRTIAEIIASAPATLDPESVRRVTEYLGSAR